MSGSKKGMDTAKVKDIADRLAQAHRDLVDAASAADSAVVGLKGQWRGGDARAFYAKWPARKEGVDLCATGVSSLEKALRADISEQDTASEAAGATDSDGDGTPDNRDDDGDNDGTPDDQDPDDDNDGTPDDEDETPIKGSAKTPIRERGGDPDDRHYTDESPRHRDGSGGERSDKSYRNHEGEDWQRGSTHERNWGDKPGDHLPGEHAGKPGVDVEGKVNVVEGKYDHTFGPQGTIGDRDGNYIGYDVGRVEAEGSAGLTMTSDSVKVGASGSVSAMAASVSAAYKNSYGTSAEGKAYVGAEANGDVGVGLGKDGIEAGAHAEAFAGGKAEGSVSQAVGPVDVGVGGEVSYGIGAHADVDAGFTKDHIGLNVDIGATLGLGAGVKFDVGFDPPDIDLPDVDLNPTHWHL